MLRRSLLGCVDASPSALTPKLKYNVYASFFSRRRRSRHIPQPTEISEPEEAGDGYNNNFAARDDHDVVNAARDNHIGDISLEDVSMISGNNAENDGGSNDEELADKINESFVDPLTLFPEDEEQQQSQTKKRKKSWQDVDVNDNNDEEEVHVDEEEDEEDVDGVVNTSKLAFAFDAGWTMEENVDFFWFQDTLIVLVAENQKVVMAGSAYCQLLGGTAKILGAFLHSGSREVEIHAVEPMGLVCIECSVSSSLSSPHSNIRDMLPAAHAGDRAIIESMNAALKSKHRGAVLQFRKFIADSDVPEKYLAQVVSVRKEIRTKSFVLVTECRSSIPVVQLSSDAEHVVKVIADATQVDLQQKIVVIGDRSTGKSTMSRLLINMFVSRYGSAALVNMDLGQAECNPSGMVSLHLIEQPLIGPPDSHIQTPKSSYFIGNTTPNNDPQSYLDAAEKLRQDFSFLCSEIGNIPLVINTHGWITGLGLDLTTKVIQLFAPQHIVEMRNKYKKHPFLDFSKASFDFGFKEYKVDSHLSDVDQRTIGRDSSHHRNQLLYSYFLGFLSSRNISSIPHLLTQEDRNTYSIPFAAVDICFSKWDVHPNHVLAALNGTLVAIAAWHRPAPHPVVINFVVLVECFGYGIVKRVDVERKLLWITTPVDPHKLAAANLLIRGHLNLPSAALQLKNALTTGPYLTADSVNTAVSVEMRKRYENARARAGKN